MTTVDSLPQLVPVLGGFRVKTTETHHIDVMKMIFNWRVVMTPLDNPMVYDHGWCYFGTGADTLMRAVMAAWAWDGAENTSPSHYDKQAF